MFEVLITNLRLYFGKLGKGLVHSFCSTEKGLVNLCVASVRGTRRAAHAGATMAMRGGWGLRECRFPHASPCICFKKVAFRRQCLPGPRPPNDLLLGKRNRHARLVAAPPPANHHNHHNSRVGPLPPFNNCARRFQRRVHTCLRSHACPLHDMR